MMNANLFSTPDQPSELPYQSYSVGALAHIYYPHVSQKSATRNLSRYILLDTELFAALLALGYHKGIRILTPAMVGLIVSSMGTPQDFNHLTR